MDLLRNIPETGHEHSLQNVAIIFQDFLPTCKDANTSIFVIKLLLCFVHFIIWYKQIRVVIIFLEQCPVYLLIPIGCSVFWVMSSCPNIEEEWWEWCSPKETIVVEEVNTSCSHKSVRPLSIYFSRLFRNQCILGCHTLPHKFGCQNGKATGLQAYRGADGNTYCCVQIGWWAYLSDMFLSYDKKPTISFIHHPETYTFK